MTSASVMAQNLSRRPSRNDLKSASVVRAQQYGITRRKLQRPLMDVIASLGNVASKFTKVPRSLDGQHFAPVWITYSRYGGNVRGKHLKVSISLEAKTVLAIHQVYTLRVPCSLPVYFMHAHSAADLHLTASPQ